MDVQRISSRTQDYNTGRRVRVCNTSADADAQYSSRRETLCLVSEVMLILQQQQYVSISSRPQRHGNGSVLSLINVWAAQNVRVTPAADSDDAYSTGCCSWSWFDGNVWMNADIAILYVGASGHVMLVHWRPFINNPHAMEVAATESQTGGPWS